MARHAVVVGGGIAGLLTARVLAEHASRVTLLERDRLPERDVPRAGVPQGRHVHVLPAGGQRALESLLPGCVAELRTLGAPRVGMPDELVQWQAGGWYRRTPATAHLMTGSRAQLEGLVRRRVLAHPRVEVVPGVEAVGLLGDAERVRGVLVRERGASLAPRPMPAALVVDASGRGSRAPEWLVALGAPPPREETLDTGLAYASRLYQAPPAGALGVDCRGLYVVPDAAQNRGAVVLPLEGDRWIVTLSGLRGDEPPTDGAEFTEFARALPHRLVHDWLRHAEPAGPVHAFRNTGNLRRRYDEPGRPGGFLVVGDALCAFNPVYGQGMAVAALNAVALRNALAEPGRPRARRVQRAVFRSARHAWEISAGVDRALPGAVGTAAGLRLVDRPFDWYLGRVEERAMGDPDVGAVFRAVLALAAPPAALCAPRIARRVLFDPPRPAPAEPPARPEPVRRPAGRRVTGG